MSTRYWQATLCGIGGWLLFFVVCPYFGLLAYSSGHILLLGVYFIVAVPFLLITTVLLGPQNLGQSLRIAALESGLLFFLAPFSLVWQQSRAFNSSVREYAGDVPMLLITFALFVVVSTLALAVVAAPLVKLIRRIRTRTIERPPL